MEEGADWDSDETVIEGSVTESEQEEEELPWRRLLFDQDTSLRREFSLHPGISGTCRGTHSPEIQLIFKLRGNSQEQMSKNKMMPLLSEDAALQQPQDEMEQNQVLLQTRKSSPMFAVSCTQAELSLNHQSIRGTEAENPEVLPHPEKELSAGRDSPEISLLSGTTTEESSTFPVKEKSLIEPKKILAAPNTFSEPGKEVVLTVTSKETKDEESSLETFVSALEGLLTSPEITQEERLFGIVSNFEPRELMNPLSNSLGSLSMPLTCHEDLLENTKDDALPAELLAALNTLSEAKVEPICHRKEGGICLSTGNECLEVEPGMSQIDEDCTQVAEVNFETLCSTPPFEQDSRLAELQNKHLSVQQVAELLLLNGADPLFRNDNGKCALDEAKDLCMKRLLERYVSKRKRHLTSAQKNSTDPSDREDAHQHKKPKFSSKNHSGFACDENSNRQKPEHAKVNKEGKDSLFINKEAVYEYYQKDSQSRKFGKSKYKQSALNQKYSIGLKKDDLHNVRNPSTNVSKDKGRRNTRHKRIQVDHIIQESNPRKKIAVSSSRRTNKLVPHQQQILQTLDDLPEKSCKPSSSAPSGLKIGLSNNVGTCSVSKETHTQSLDLSDSQEIKFLGLESIDQAEAVSFSGLFLNKMTKLPPVTADQQPQTHQDQQHTSPCKSYENSNSDQKDESHNKWENSSPSFIKENFNDGDDDTGSRASGETVKSKKVVSFSGYKNQDNYKENITNREEMDFQQFLPSEDHFSQGNAFKADNLTIVPQQEAINFSNSGNIMVSEHVPDYEQCACRTSFDHLHGSPEHTSSACTRTHSIHEVSKLTSHMELFERPQDCSYRTSAPLMNQTDAHTVEKVNKKGDAERNYTDKGQKTSSSNSSLSTVVHSQVIETTKAEKRRQENKTIHNMDFHSTDNISKELTSISQLSQREEKEISHKADEELTIIVNGDESTIRNCEEKKEKTDLEIHMPTNIQEHKKVKNLRKRQNFLKATCSQALGRKEALVMFGKFTEMETAGINKRPARGESRLHLAARRGNLSLVKALVQSGADVNLKDNAGWTPLREAASEGCNDTIVELLKANAKVNCGNLDGILPLHDAVANNHLKATEILLQHGANPNQKDKKQKTALDEADDENTKELLKSYGAVETDNRAEANAVVTVKTPAVWSKRHKQCFCDDCKTVDIPSLSNQGKKVENLPMHQNVSAILQDIEEKQENLLEFEIRTPEDAEQYIDKMLEVKEVMDNVLAKQKAERDDLAKKYRVSMESFKQGVLREQLVNLATRQKSLLTVTKNQKKIREKIHNYKNVTPLSGLSFKKLPSSSEISNEKSRQEFTSLETSVQPQSGSLSPVSLVYGSMQETQLSSEIWHDSQNTNTCLNSKGMRREGFSGNELNSKLISDYTLDRLSKSRHSDGTKKIKLPSQSVTFITQAEYSQKENDLTDMAAKEHASFRPSAVTGALNISETTSVLSHNEPYPSAVLCDQAFSSCDPKRDNRKTASQQPPRRASESLAHREIDVFGSNTGHQMKPYLKKSAVAVPHANDSQSSSSSESSRQHTIKKPLNYSTAPKKKCMQIKDLILLGRINPGNNILEFKTQVFFFSKII
ncbi:putative ankyrin repeat domain-containing protein 31 [Camelus dromedarius]|uniref:Putative ankyrin repeat domain-containing protein 31 n=1 Tax=Camelus dromedarius TaxID=9838 RepID=A0A5N4ED70_CAMDR|nr:putative ankyrin repeat domain-containing protein 31 [Camelus dromedarius]